MLKGEHFTARAPDDAQLCVETVGRRGDPAVLLIGGATWSMDWWEDDLCRRLAERGRLVIRYDHRDTGRSTGYPPGKPGYTTADQVSDAVAILDALEIDRAHVVGLSMGGRIAQRMALAFAETGMAAIGGRRARLGRRKAGRRR
jgi:pimeloyl-ACP methyl ester carboxylesterase